MEYHHFKVDIRNKIAQVVIHRPEKSNALNMEAWKEMQRIFDTLSDTSGVRVIVLKGEGKHFCAGIDLDLLRSISSLEQTECSGRRNEKIRAQIKILQNAVNAIDHCSKPVLAAIHNGCIGGGVDIVSACDMRYCCEDAYFTIKEIDMGMVADLGSLQRLPNIISPGLAAELAYTGREVSGEEACRMGLVNHCYTTRDKLYDGIMEIAATIASRSPLSVRGTKEVLRYTRDHSVEDGLNYVSVWNSAMLVSEDLKEAMLAFMEDRTPNFDD